MVSSDRSTSKRYFYAADGQRRGPVTCDELRRLAASGKLSRSDMVWQEGEEKGKPASWVQGVFSEAAVSTSTAPPDVTVSRRLSSEDPCIIHHITRSPNGSRSFFDARA